MKSFCGSENASDALVSVDLSSDNITIDIQSKLKKMFGGLMEKAVNDALKEMNIKNAYVIVKDFGALDFVIRARTKTAVTRALKEI